MAVAAATATAIAMAVAGAIAIAVGPRPQDLQQQMLATVLIRRLGRAHAGRRAVRVVHVQGAGGGHLVSGADEVVDGCVGEVRQEPASEVVVDSAREQLIHRVDRVGQSATADVLQHRVAEGADPGDLLVGAGRVSGPGRAGEQDLAGRRVQGAEHHVQRVVRGRRQLAPAAQHRSGLVPAEGDHAGRDLGVRVQAGAQLRHDAEVPAASAQAPEQLGLVLRIGGDHSAVGQHDLGRQHVVDTEADQADQCPVPAAEGQPGEADRAHGAHRRGVPVRAHRVQDVADGRAAGHPRLRALDGDLPHGAQVDQQARVADGAAGPVVASAEHRERQARRLRREYRGLDVVGRAAAGDHGRTLPYLRVPRPHRIGRCFSDHDHVGRQLLSQQPDGDLDSVVCGGRHDSGCSFAWRCASFLNRHRRAVAMHGSACRGVHLENKKSLTAELSGISLRVRRQGLEPRTRGLRVRCSAN